MAVNLNKAVKAGLDFLANASFPVEPRDYRQAPTARSLYRKGRR